MENLTISLDLRGFNNLLNGLNQINFGDDKSVDESKYTQLIEKVYKNSTLDPQDIRNEISLYELILKKAGHDSWTEEALENFLQNRSFPEEHIQVFLRFWNKESSQVS
jgi:hypothetical protein